MVAPKTYTGYDKDGKAVAHATGVDANEYINPDEVQTAIDKVGTVAEEQMKTISSALNGISGEAADAVIVQGTKIDTVIEEVSKALDSVAGSIKDSLSDMYTQAVKAHDTLQTQANDEAYNAVASASGVVSVS